MRLDDMGGDCRSMIPLLRAETYYIDSIASSAARIQGSTDAMGWLQIDHCNKQSDDSMDIAAVYHTFSWPRRCSKDFERSRSLTRKTQNLARTHTPTHQARTTPTPPKSKSETHIPPNSSSSSAFSTLPFLYSPSPFPIPFFLSCSLKRFSFQSDHAITPSRRVSLFTSPSPFPRPKAGIASSPSDSNICARCSRNPARGLDLGASAPPRHSGVAGRGGALGVDPSPPSVILSWLVVCGAVRGRGQEKLTTTGEGAGGGGGGRDGGGGGGGRVGGGGALSVLWPAEEVRPFVWGWNSEGRK